MSNNKTNCSKCKKEIHKKSGLCICDPCMKSSPAMMINTVSFDKKLSKEPQSTIEKAVVDDALKGSPLEEYVNMVDHPSHYNMGSIEVIDAIEDWDLDFRLGNAVKYVVRAGRKNDKVKQDLEKALWYIQRYIDKEC